MFGAVRRFGVSQALRASAPRTLSSRWAPQLLKWQAPATRSPVLIRSFQTSYPALSAASAEASEAPAVDQELITEFADLQTKGFVDASIVRNIISPDRMGLKTMTDVQSQSLHHMLQGGDVLAQAKTGTGKTLAFLLPTMQNILSDPTLNTKQDLGRRGQPSAADIRALIISPTRELAEQIAAEAMKVAAGTGLKVQTAVGGTQKRLGLQRIQRMGCHLLVGTPGRIKDIFSDPSSGVSAPRLNTLILDEADHPFKVSRQTVMFSATVPKEVMHMVKRTMKPDFKFVKTVRDDEVPTHLRVPQKTVFLRGYENALPSILELAKNYQVKQQANPDLRPFKAIVYFNSTAEVNLAAEAFNHLKVEPTEQRSQNPLGRMRLLEIHARLSQSQRTNSANTFRKSSEAILFSSDVTARGMDFPEVTHVIQVGVPRDRETYIHRLGRTARANKTGEGWMFLHDGENDYFSDRLRDLPIHEDSQSIPTAMADMSKGLDNLSPATALTISQIKAAVQEVPLMTRESTYRSQLGTLLQSFASKRHAIRILNDLALNGYGLSEPPAVSPNIARNLGISKIPELVIGHSQQRHVGLGQGSSSTDRVFGGHRSSDRSSGSWARSFDRSDRSDRSDRGSSRGFNDRGGMPRRSFDRDNDRGDRSSGRGRSFGGRERSSGGRERSSGFGSRSPF
ncbi:ATP-dependent RNA helicase [Penicillium atrosanguineum]|nr:ATP-dependent RNA helicase [Penicillium atrosanguineum]